jgi:YHS domain-containing protein/cbb3-type cytochrome oxidase subunit 3
MSTSGLVVEGLFAVLGWIPETRPSNVVHTGFQWNYTTFLNIVFLVLFGVLYWLYRNRDRLRDASAYAFDPICGMQVRIAEAPATRRRDGDFFAFCSDHCAERFDATVAP